MKVVLKVGKVDALTLLLTPEDPLECSMLVDRHTLTGIAGPVDVREGDALVLDVSLIRRSRPHEAPGTGETTTYPGRQA